RGRRSRGQIPARVDCGLDGITADKGIPYKNFVAVEGLLHVRTLGKHGMRLRLCVPPGQRSDVLKTKSRQYDVGTSGDEKYVKPDRGEVLLARAKATRSELRPRLHPMSSEEVASKRTPGVHGDNNGGASL
ncbi:Uncharacterized protein APZ42_010053, partial [Daphnia magna]